MKHTLCWIDAATYKTPGSVIGLSTAKPMTNEVEPVPPQKRVY